MTQPSRQPTHEVFNVRTQSIVGRYTSAHAARRVADRRDSEYGAVICVVRPIRTGGAA